MEVELQKYPLCTKKTIMASHPRCTLGGTPKVNDGDFVAQRYAREIKLACLLKNEPKTDWKQSLKNTIQKQGVIGTLENYSLDTDTNLKQKINYFYKGYNNSINYKKWMEFKEDAQVQSAKNEESTWKEISKIVKDDEAINCFKSMETPRKGKCKKKSRCYRHRNKLLSKEKFDTEKHSNFSHSRMFTPEANDSDQFQGVDAHPHKTLSMHNRFFSFNRDDSNNCMALGACSPHSFKNPHSPLRHANTRRPSVAFQNHQGKHGELTLSPSNASLSPSKLSARVDTSKRRDACAKSKKIKRRQLKTSFKGFMTQNPFLNKIMTAQRKKCKIIGYPKKNPKSMKIKIDKRLTDEIIEIPPKAKRNRCFSVDEREEETLLSSKKSIDEENTTKRKVRKSWLCQPSQKDESPKKTDASNSPSKANILNISPTFPGSTNTGTSSLHPSELLSFLESGSVEAQPLLLKRPQRILSPKPAVKVKLIRPRRTKKLTKEALLRPYVL
ncbi:unnamed protein product [Moneuplotes crassus]|uniref:Uncharacterized protein n=1 Tax=Euplotes crassus TaxID=5936 RepID=A0AAD1Y3C9_EUPCR|nr:unnamed protein product [Moneuplotes crassus]